MIRLFIIENIKEIFMNDHTKTKEDRNEFVPMRVASQLTGLHPQTIRQYADEGKIQFYRTPFGQRRIHKQSLQTLINPDVASKESSTDNKISYVYGRISSKKQSDDLLRQIQFLQSKYPSYVVSKDIASGITFQRKGLQTILDACLQGTLGEVVVAHRDRLARFGFDLLKYIIERSGSKLTVIDDQRNKSTEQELSEDLHAIVHIYSCRQMGKRSYANRKRNSSEITENQIET